MPSDITKTYTFIAAQAAQFAVTDLCQTMCVSRSGYYAWHERPTPTDQLTPQVTAAFWRHARRYGSRRLTAELQAEHLVIGRRRVRLGLPSASGFDVASARGPRLECGTPAAARVDA